MRLKKILFISLAAMIFINGCSFNPADYANSDSNKIYIGLAVSTPDIIREYEMAMQIAQENIDNMNLPVDVEIIMRDDYETYNVALNAATEFVSNPDMIGVVGHIKSDMCSAMASIYEQNEMVMLIPTSTSINLFNEGYEYVYQGLPCSQVISTLITAESVYDGTENAAIIYADTDDGKQFANTLVSSFSLDGFVSIIDTVCMPEQLREFPTSLQKWNALDYQKVFLATTYNGYIYYTESIKNDNPDASILCTSNLGFDLVISEADFVDDITFCSSFYSQYNDKSKYFTERFMEILPEYYTDEYTAITESYNIEEPSADAAQIYECIMMIAKAIQNGVTTSQQLKQYFDTSQDVGYIYEGAKFGGNPLLSDGSHCIYGRPSFLISYNSDASVAKCLEFSDDDIYDMWVQYYSDAVIEKYFSPQREK